MLKINKKIMQICCLTAGLLGSFVMNGSNESPGQRLVRRDPVTIQINDATGEISAPVREGQTNLFEELLGDDNQQVQTQPVFAQQNGYATSYMPTDDNQFMLSANGNDDDFVVYGEQVQSRPLSRGITPIGYEYIGTENGAHFYEFYANEDDVYQYTPGGREYKSQAQYRKNANGEVQTTLNWVPYKRGALQQDNVEGHAVSNRNDSPADGTLVPFHTPVQNSLNVTPQEMGYEKLSTGSKMNLGNYDENHDDRNDGSDLFDKQYALMRKEFNGSYENNDTVSYATKLNKSFGKGFVHTVMLSSDKLGCNVFCKGNVFYDSRDKVVSKSVESVKHAPFNPIAGAIIMPQLVGNKKGPKSPYQRRENSSSVARLYFTDSASISRKSNSPGQEEVAVPPVFPTSASNLSVTSNNLSPFSRADKDAMSPLPRGPVVE